MRCVHNEKSSAVSHVIKGIIRRGGFLSVFLCTFISLCIIIFFQSYGFEFKKCYIYMNTDWQQVRVILTKLRGLYFEHRAARQASTFCSAVVSCSVCGSEIQVWGQRTYLWGMMALHIKPNAFPTCISTLWESRKASSAVPTAVLTARWRLDIPKTFNVLLSQDTYAVFVSFIFVIDSAV